MTACWIMWFGGFLIGLGLGMSLIADRMDRTAQTDKSSD